MFLSILNRNEYGQLFLSWDFSKQGGILYHVESQRGVNLLPIGFIFFGVLCSSLF